MQEEFKIFIHETEIQDNKIQEGDHYLALGNIMIKIENKNYPDLTLGNNKLALKYYLALINARTKYMFDIITQLNLEKEMLFETCDLGGCIDTFKREEIYKFFLKERKIIESMIKICELSYNSANKIIYQKYFDENMPKIRIQNTNDEEEA